MSISLLDRYVYVINGCVKFRLAAGSFILFFFFPLGRFLNGHIVKFFGIEDIPAFQAFNVFGVFVAGNNANPRVFAGGNHRFGQARI